MSLKITSRQLIEPGTIEKFRYNRSDPLDDSGVCQVYDLILKETYPYHWLEFFEIALILSGECTHAINGNSYPVEPGTIFLLSPADFHTMIIPDGVQIGIMGIMFDEGVMDDQLRGWLFSNRNNYNLLLSPANFQSILNLFETIAREYHQPQIGSSRIINTTLQNILIQLARCDQKSNTVESPQANPQFKNSDPMQKALLYIHHHFRQPLTLDQVAGQAGFSANYFSERFHKMTDTTFQHYIQALRLRFSAGLLSASDLPVKEIAFASGFNNFSHFGRAFKAVYHLSPRLYRHKNQEEVIKTG